MPKLVTGKGVILILALAGTAACVPWIVGRALSVPPELERLYSEIRAARLAYERGIESVLAGDSVGGRRQLAAATDDLVRQARECAHDQPCDAELFLLSLAELYERRSHALGVGTTLDAAPEREFDRPRPGAPERDLRGRDLDELIRLNREVRAALNDWLTWKRPELVDTFDNYRFLRADLAPIYREAGLPEGLLFAIMATESRAKAHAFSRAGAAGPMQFMQRTAMRYGLGSDDGFDLRLDPVASTSASASYLNDRLDDLDDDLEKALAAYNVGESRLRRLHIKLDGSSFWDPQMQKSLPLETRKYVPQVLAAAWLFLRPEEVGVTWPTPEEVTPLSLRHDASLEELAICLGQEGNPRGWFRTLRNLNPRRASEERVAAGEEVRVPARLVTTYEQQCVGESPLRAWARRLHPPG